MTLVDVYSVADQETLDEFVFTLTQAGWVLCDINVTLDARQLSDDLWSPIIQSRINPR